MQLTLQIIVNGLVAGADYVLIALGLSLVFGVLKVVNFAHGELFLLGAVAAYFAQEWLHTGYLVSVLLGIVVTVVLAVIAEQLTVRPLRSGPEENIFLSTFGLSLVILYGVSIALDSQTVSLRTDLTGTTAVAGLQIADQQFLVLGAAIVLTAGLFLVLARTRAGVVVKAVAENRYAASLLGLRVTRIYTATFAAAAGLAAVAGALVVPLSSLSPASGQSVLLKTFIIVVAAGLGNLRACVAVAVTLGVLENLVAAFLKNSASEFVAYVLLVLVLLVAPQGLGGRFRFRRRRPGALGEVTA